MIACDGARAQLDSSYAIMFFRSSKKGHSPHPRNPSRKSKIMRTLASDCACRRAGPVSSRTKIWRSMSSAATSSADHRPSRVSSASADARSRSACHAAGHCREKQTPRDMAFPKLLCACLSPFTSIYPVDSRAARNWCCFQGNGRLRLDHLRTLALQCLLSRWQASQLVLNLHRAHAAPRAGAAP